MTYGNLIKNKIQHEFSGLFDTLLIKRKLTDAQMECMQFGICDSELNWYRYRSSYGKIISKFHLLDLTKVS